MRTLAHIGIPINEKPAKGTYLEGAKLYITDPADTKNNLEFLYFEKDCPMPEIVKKSTHIAYIVDDIGAFHYTLMFDAPEDNAAFDELIGGHYQKGYSYNPFYDARFELDPSQPAHPTLRGVKPFGYYDEWHFSIYFTKNPAQKITPLLKTKVPDKIRRRRSAPQVVRDGLGKDRLEIVAWVVENPNGTRGFGIMGGHVPWTLAQKDYRKFVLNTIFWLAEVDIPESGYDASVPPFDSLVSKITKPKRGDYQYYIKDWRDFDTAARAEK